METRQMVTESVFLSVSNQRLRRIRLEPWADEYEIASETRYELRAISPVGINGLEIQIGRQGIVVYANEGVLDIYLDGSPLPQVPGYNWD